MASSEAIRFPAHSHAGAAAHAHAAALHAAGALASLAAATAALAALATSATLAFAAFAGGPLSGGAFNPIVGVGPIAVDALLGRGDMVNAWLYIVGPFAGGALAASTFRLQNPEEV